MAYAVRLISIEEKEEQAERYAPQVRYEIKFDIYGCCIKLLTGDRAVKERWEENFYFISQNIRSHGRLYVVSDPGVPENTVLFDPASKTAFLINIGYYGWIKSLALSVAGDILEDEHGIYSVHGACIDVGGRGCCILGASGAGKTTQTYGLLRDGSTRVVADDWFFARIFGSEIFAYGSEKNFYIRADLATIWPAYADLIRMAEFDAEGRAVVDLRLITGKGRILPMTTLGKMFILYRDPARPLTPESPTAAEALSMLEANGWFNPHLLLRSSFKEDLRRRFFSTLCAAVGVTLVNTAGTPEETQQTLASLIHA
ncbi:MAG: aldolase [Methanomicrobiaceae archaeon]|nr:aldolase [Methanomicrobiaceae archaeon]